MRKRREARRKGSESIARAVADELGITTPKEAKGPRRKGLLRINKEIHMARADKATTKPQKGNLDRDATRRQQPGAQGAGKDADALDEAGNVDESKLKQNQHRLKVDADHKTPTMRKQRRGTFP